MSWKRFTNRLQQARAHLAERLAQLWKHSFYLYLAGLFTVFAVLDTTMLHFTGELRQTAFDAMVRHRIIVPKPDPDIVIVDIDEASLAAMSQDYGRWPWPRQVLGEFLEHLEKQQPRAVVFDILFSDADVYNPDSDAYFKAAIAATDNTYFPMLRLDPASDHLSQVKPSMIPGVTPLPVDLGLLPLDIACVLRADLHLQHDLRREAFVLSGRGGADFSKRRQARVIHIRPAQELECALVARERRAGKHACLIDRRYTLAQHDAREPADLRFGCIALAAEKVPARIIHEPELASDRRQPVICIVLAQE